MARPTTAKTGEIAVLLEEWMNRRTPPRTQEELAKAMGVSSSLVSQWRYRQVQITMPTLARMQEKLDLDLARLVAAAQADMPAASEHVTQRRSKRPGSAK